jgi:hypothetical protein
LTGTAEQPMTIATKYHYRLSQKVRNHFDISKIFPIRETKIKQNDSWMDIADEVIEQFMSKFERLIRENEGQMLTANLLASVSACVDRQGLERTYSVVQSMVDQLAAAICDP